MRMQTKEEQAAHGELHARRLIPATMAQRAAAAAAAGAAAQRSRSRTWWQTAADWVSSTKAVTEVDTLKALKEMDDKPNAVLSEVQSVKADESRALCSICGERFEHYLDNNDEWMFRDAVENKENGTYAHIKCLGVDKLKGAATPEVVTPTEPRSPAN
eukprot:m51a1_g9226 putative enth vhs-like protein (158) ;mRNA; r:71183-72642